jgi:hypothetical protein
VIVQGIQKARPGMKVAVSVVQPAQSGPDIGPSATSGTQPDPSGASPAPADAPTPAGETPAPADGAGGPAPADGSGGASAAPAAPSGQ